MLHDRGRLTHFLHADHGAIVAIAVLADGDVELHFLVAIVGLRLAQIPRRAGTADHDAGEAPLPRVFKRDDADVDVTLFENAVFDEQRFEIVADLQERIAEGADVFDELVRQIAADAARTEIIGVHTGAAGALVEHHQFLALFITPQRRGQRANVHRLRRDVQQMRQQTADFGVEHADQLTTTRHFNIQQTLDRQTEGVLLIHRRAVIEPVEIGHILQIGARLHQLLGAAMQEADMRIDALDDFAVEFENQTQNAVGRRMLRTEIDVEVTLAPRGGG